ncbi:MAG: gamma-glutamylcyclotransferase [Pseudomonadota bacterium]
MILPVPGEQVFGVVFDIAPPDKPVLDKYEMAYHTQQVELSVGHAFTYIPRTERIDTQAVPYDWYKALVLAGAELHKFPEAYIEQIRQIPTLADADPERVAHAEQILKTFI